MFPRYALVLSETVGFGGALTPFRVVASTIVFSVGSVSVIASIVRLVAVVAYHKSNDRSCELEPRRRPSGRHRSAR